MKIKKELLQDYLDEHELSAAILARNMGVNTAEVEKLLSGIAVNEETARRFIYYFGADNAAKFIDWAAIGKQNPRPQQNFGGKELDQTPSASAPAAKKKKKRTAERLRRLMVGVAGAAVVTVAVVLPANVPKAQTDIRYTDTAIYYTIEVPQTDMQVTLVAENDFTRREQPLVPGSNEGVIEGLKPGMQYTVKVEGKLGPITLSLSDETVRTQTEAPKTQLFGVTHECTCNVDGLFHFTVDYIDEAGRWSDFEASLTDARGNRSSCAFTQDAHAPQSIDVIGAGLVGNSAAFVITCLDAESGGRTVLYEAQVKI